MPLTSLRKKALLATLLAAFALVGCNGAAGDEPAAMPPTQEAEPTEVEAPEPTEPPAASDNAASFDDREGDVFICDAGEDTVMDDPASDILEMGVSQLDDGVQVRMRLSQSALESSDDFRLSIQARIGQSGGYQVGIYEYNDGSSKIGRLETVSEVEAGTEGDVRASDEWVAFFFPDLVLQEGDTVTGRTFHMLTDGVAETCDVTQAFSLDDLLTD